MLRLNSYGMAVIVALLLCVTRFAPAAMVNVETDLGQAANVADTLYTPSGVGFLDVELAHDNTMSNLVPFSDSVGGPSVVPGTIHTLVFDLNVGETAPDLTKIGVWLDGDVSTIYEINRLVTQVEFKVTSEGGSAVSVGTVLKDNFIAPATAGTPQEFNSLTRYAYAEVVGNFSKVVKFELLFTQANFTTGGPRVSEVIALDAAQAAIVPEPGAAALLGVSLGGLFLKRRRFHTATTATGP